MLSNGIEVNMTVEKKTRTLPPATEKQKAFARDLGIEFSQEINIEEMSNLLDAAIEKRKFLLDGGADKKITLLVDATPGDMTAELLRRGLQSFVCTWKLEDMVGDHVEANFVCDESVGEFMVHRVIMLTTLQMMVQKKTANILKLLSEYGICWEQNVQPGWDMSRIDTSDQT